MSYLSSFEEPGNASEFSSPHAQAAGSAESHATRATVIAPYCMHEIALVQCSVPGAHVLATSGCPRSLIQPHDRILIPYRKLETLVLLDGEMLEIAVK